MRVLTHLLFSLAAASRGEEAAAVIHFQADKPGRAIPADFIGLSYEKTAMAERHFHAGNATLINLHRNLGRGVLRIGGNKVELSRWQGGEAGGKEQPGITPITAVHVDDFYAFIRAVDWKVIHGVNLAGREPVNSAAEVSYAAKVGSESILAFEIGNEPDHYYLPPRKTFREKGYGYAQYKEELSEAIRAIRAAAPGAPLTGPANTSRGNQAFFEPCLADFKDQLALATSHYYPTTNREPFPTIELLLSEKTREKTLRVAEANLAAARKAGIPWRLAECNSASLGGTTGMSDVHAAAVWGVGFLFDLAERGVAGINFHTIFGTRGYTAIAYDKKTGAYSARPLYHALVLFKDAGHGKVLPVETRSSANIAAHATLGSDGRIRVVVINRELGRTATATVNTGTGRKTGTLARLTGKSPSDKTTTAYAGMSVTSEGKLTPAQSEVVPGDGGSFRISLPPCSVAVLTLEGR